MLKAIYNYSPVWFQNLMCSVKGWNICRRRYNKNFFDELENFESGYYKQQDCLSKFLRNIANTPYYKKSFKQYNIDLNSADIYSEIKKLPIISKKFVKEHLQDFVNPDYSKPTFEYRTSGTTGAGLQFPYPIEMENKQWAVWWRYRQNIGIRFNTWCGWFGGQAIIPKKNSSSVYWRFNNPGKQLMFSSYHLTRETVRYYHEQVIKNQLPWLHGYPSHISKFAALSIDENLAPIQCVKYVTTGSENVLGNQLEMMHKVFPNAIIRQHYGLGEGVANISQDVNGVWHVDDDFCYVEFIPVSEENKTNCHIIGTSFWNEAFPLVRYDTGDIATVDYDAKGNVKVLSIDGRSSNVIKQASGHEICEASLSIILHDFSNIVEAQFHQYSLTKVVLEVVKGIHFSEQDEKLLLDALRRTFDEGMNIGIKYVDSVERTKSGKLKIVISEMA